MNNVKKKYITVICIIVILFFTKDIDLSNKWYKDIKLVNNPNSLTVLVNKNNQLLSSYVPNDLITIDNKYSNENKLLRKEAAKAFEKLSYDASKSNYRIVAVSAYRSYDYQKDLFNHYVKTKGLDYALRCSAKAGFSEHQTGLSIDVEGSNRDYDNFEDSNEFEWMTKNAHKYGFIIRYPKGKEKVTGFKYEPWHYRYVGKKVAKCIYESDLTLEEYLEKKAC